MTNFLKNFTLWPFFYIQIIFCRRHLTVLIGLINFSKNVSVKGQATKFVVLELARSQTIFQKTVKKTAYPYLAVLGVIQKIRVKIGGREGSSELTQNVTMGKEGVHQFNTLQFQALDNITFFGNKHF